MFVYACWTVEARAVKRLGVVTVLTNLTYFQQSQANKHKTYMNEDEFETEFNKRFGFGIWDSRARNGHRNEGISSTDVLEFSKAFIRKVESEAYEKGKKEALGNPLYIIDKDGSVNLTETIELAYQRGKKEVVDRIPDVYRGMLTDWLKESLN